MKKRDAKGDRWVLVPIHLSYHYHTINPCNLTFVDKLLIKNLLLQKPMDKPHLQISCTLNLAAQILKKHFFERNQKKSKVKSWEDFFIHCSLNVNSLLPFQQKILQSFTHNFSTSMNLISTNFDAWLIFFWYLLTGISSFNTVFPKIFALQQEHERTIRRLVTRH